ncbi:tripartite motif-containing protein 16-like [Anomaloglossus baeobatrachus]|uniref:tripartite motif-containing protein 16-like n=1 Tax=Anomaloglossus baeobatrachus TaxID=238106 RepID=UPI003F4F71C8
MEETRIFCTFCTKSPVPAVKTCLQCETSMCEEHLTAHNKIVDHILTEPTASFGHKKCSLHKKVLEYYCPQDAACLCASCCLVGEHRGHQVELLDEASEKKENLRKYLDELNPQKEEIQARVHNLQDHKRKIQETASDKRKNVSKIFMDIKKKLKMAEKKVISKVSRQEEKIVSQISHLIQKLEIQEDNMSRKMHHVEEMCGVTDPIRLLQESDITECSHGGEEDTRGDGGEVSSEEDLDEVLISLTLLRSMRDIVTNVTSELGVHVPDILLDVDTAHRWVTVSQDLKTATDLGVQQKRRKSSGRFVFNPQVLSRCSLSSGRHYWEVECSLIGRCDIGLCYPSIKRKGEESGIGYNDKSWGLALYDEEYEVWHNSDVETLSMTSTCLTLGVFLDYEAGRLSFYELCDPIRHLHTFTASFSEPLHVVFGVVDEASVTIRS